MNRRDVHETLPWMAAGTEFFGRILDALPDEALRQPSALPDWSRAHVVAHLARNAEALTRLATWASTGVETPMYPDPESRNADIEATATAPAETLRADVARTAAELDAALAALDAGTWQREVRSAQGRAMPAAEVPWMRIREVWLHAVDLDGGASIEDIPPAVVDALLDDATGTLTAREGCPAAVLAPTDRTATWALGPDTEPVELHGTATELLGWLLGRTDGAGVTAADGKVPTAPRWL